MLIFEPNEETLDSGSAILLCSDGLSDMVPSATIERLVREHAGRPDDVAEALVAAANEAGGKDNITVVYAEGPDFADLVRRPAAPAATPPPSASTAVRSRKAVTRTGWFVLGALLGVGTALGAALHTSAEGGQVPAPDPGQGRRRRQQPGPQPAADRVVHRQHPRQREHRALVVLGGAEQHERRRERAVGRVADRVG